MQKLFLSTKSSATAAEANLPADKPRLHLLELLRQVVFHFLTTAPESEFVHEALDFFLLVANAGAVPLEDAAVSPNVASAGLTQLGRCLGLMIRRVSLRAEMKVSDLICQSSNLLFLRISQISLDSTWLLSPTDSRALTVYKINEQLHKRNHALSKL